MITVINEVKVYEIDDKELQPVGDETLVITSHWNSKQRVNIITNGRKITVIASDLKTAIENATNINRY